MVVLSAAICSRTGRALMARQFVEMSRLRTEGLLAAFPKLLGSDSKQHTFVETESVRYVYQPLEDLYLVLITNKASNIVEDVETIRLLSKVVPDVAGGTTEEKVTGKCFDLVFAFDEVITTGGYREPITLPQIRTNMEMESHEEKLANMIKASKVESAHVEAQRQADQIRKRQREAARSGIQSGGMQGIGGGSSSMDAYTPTAVGENLTPRSAASAKTTSSSNSGSSSARPLAKGMQLSSAKKQNSLVDAMVKEERLAPVAARLPTSAAATAGAAETIAAPVVNHPIMLLVEEKVKVALSRDGVLNSMEIKGLVEITVNSEEAGRCKVLTTSEPGMGFAFQTHPKINKAVYDQSGVLALKDGKGFPAERPLSILRWTLQPSSDSLVPLKINCWPEEEARGRMLVNVEYTLERPMELHNVSIVVPMAGASGAPTIINVDGSYKHNASQSTLVWELPYIDQSNQSGSLEFQVSCSDAEAFFPVQVHFTSQQLYSNMRVTGVTSVDTNTPIAHGVTTAMSSAEYTIG